MTASAPASQTSRPTALVIRTAGTNCDRELLHAFNLAGARARRVHVNELIDHPDRLGEAELIGVPGGFSYGDDVGAGRILAGKLRRRLLEPFLDAVDRGCPIIGICNGFQVLVQMGLLPDPPPRPAVTPGAADARATPRQTATLAANTSGRFIDKWVAVRPDPGGVCVWTRGMGRFPLPIAHGEGRFVAASPELLRRWRDAGQIALRYDGENPNGSQDDVAGVTDPTGLVLGLMPHPERCIDATHLPDWTRRLPQEGDAMLDAPAPGFQLFRNAVEHVTSGAPASA